MTYEFCQKNICRAWHPGRIAKRSFALAGKTRRLGPVCWVNGENLHITLMPPWHEKNVDAIISALEKLEGKFALFPLMEPLLSDTGAEYAVLKEFKL